MGVNGEALQLHAVYKKLLCKSCENSYQVLLVTCTASEHAMKMKDQIIVTIVPSYTGKNITCLLLLALLLVLHTRNNTAGNKLVIFFSIALYYGDTYIISPCSIGGLERLIYSSACMLRDITARINNFE